MFDYAPSDLPRLAHVGAETVRDWRKRGLIKGCGAARASDGAWVTDPGDPRLTGQEKWRYSLGDVLRLAMVQMITKLGPNIATALDIAEAAGMFVVMHVAPAKYGAPGPADRYLLAWPLEYGQGPAIVGKSDGLFQFVRLPDLNAYSKYATVGGIIIDFAAIADAIPAALKVEIRGSK